MKMPKKSFLRLSASVFGGLVLLLGYPLTVSAAETTQSDTQSESAPEAATTEVQQDKPKEYEVLPNSAEQQEGGSLPATQSQKDLQDNMNQVDKDIQQQKMQSEPSADAGSGESSSVDMPEAPSSVDMPEQPQEDTTVDGAENVDAPATDGAPGTEGLEPTAPADGAATASAQGGDQPFSFGDSSTDGAAAADSGDNGAFSFGDSSTESADNSGGDFSFGDGSGDSSTSESSLKTVNSGLAQPASMMTEGSTTALLAVIQFNTGSAGLSDRDEMILKQVRQIQKRFNANVKVVGHSSSFTRDMTIEKHHKVNARFAASRADVVARYLSKRGVDKDHLFVDSKAEEDPLYEEFMPSGEAGNRRTEIYISY